MTLKDRQEWCNKIKWNASESCGGDLSGAMRYCPYCEFSTSKSTCQIKQDRRDREKACAKAYNAMEKHYKKIKNKEIEYDE